MEDGKWEHEVRQLSETNRLLRRKIQEQRGREERLRESEARLRAFLDLAPNSFIVLGLDGRVIYLNPAFTDIFGWTLAELEGKRLPFVPPELETETRGKFKELLQSKTILHDETMRLTKDGRILDVIIKAVIYSNAKDEPAGILAILRDVTREKRMERNNEAMHRISMALPEYPDLEGLLDYVSSEIKRLLSAESALVILLDEEKEELFFVGSDHDNKTIRKRLKEIRFRLDQIAAGKVIKTGKPIVVNDTSKHHILYPERDKSLGFHVKNFVQTPLRSKDRIIGVLCAINKEDETFGQEDVVLLDMIGGTVALSIENARFSEEIKNAYREVASLNRAKDKVIHHMSHELKTPTSVLIGSLKTISKKMTNLPEETWKNAMKRIKRNLDRIVEIQMETEDIIGERQYKTRDLLLLMIDACTDELETLVSEEVGEGPIVDRLRQRVEDLFGTREMVSEKIVLDEFVRERLDVLAPMFSHRQVEIISSTEPTQPICMPKDPLQKIIDGLVKNAIENTPDEGKIDVIVQKKVNGPELVVRDFGVGITEENQMRIFEVFYTTQETIDYSSKKPFDFNAGGKGLDLLRMKVFSERYNFKITMVSSRCRFIANGYNNCPGRISNCAFCTNNEDCYRSGGTTFSIYFPQAL